MISMSASVIASRGSQWTIKRENPSRTVHGKKKVPRTLM
jgi:hypothetical protein